MKASFDAPNLYVNVSAKQLTQSNSFIDFLLVSDGLDGGDHKTYCLVSVS